MPASFMELRAICGGFLSTFISFMAKRESHVGSKVKPMRFLPRRYNAQSAQYVNLRTDCPLLYFTHLTYRFTHLSTYKEARFGCATAALIIVFLARLLMQSNDIETNPGPISPGPKSYADALRDKDSQHTGFVPSQPFLPGAMPVNHTANPHLSATGSNETLARMEAYMTQLTDNFIRRLQQMESGLTTATNTVSSLDSWCRSLQTDNDQLKQDVRYLSAKCAILEGQCENLYDWKDHFVGICFDTEDELDRLEMFSRRNNIKFFNVYEGPNESYTDCVRKVVQLLNRFYPIKTWSTSDIERAHRTGPNRDSKYPRPLIARLHRWQDKMTVLQEKECRKDMADTLEIRVSSDLTRRQTDVLRKERQEGNRAYFRNGRLYHSERKTPFRRQATHRSQPLLSDTEEHHECSAMHEREQITRQPSTGITAPTSTGRSGDVNRTWSERRGSEHSSHYTETTAERRPGGSPGSHSDDVPSVQRTPPTTPTTPATQSTDSRDLPAPKPTPSPSPTTTPLTTDSGAAPVTQSTPIVTQAVDQDLDSSETFLKQVHHDEQIGDIESQTSALHAVDPDDRNSGLSLEQDSQASNVQVAHELSYENEITATPRHAPHTRSKTKQTQLTDRYQRLRKSTPGNPGSKVKGRDGVK